MALPSRHEGTERPALETAGRAKKVLIVLEASQLGEPAFPLLPPGAGSRGSELILLTVLKPQGQVSLGVSGSVPVSDRRLGPAWDALVRAKRLLEDRGFQVRAAIRTGEPADEIIRYAREIRADLIALATSRRDQRAALRVGSVAKEVRRRMPVPVLIIIPPASTGSEGSSKTAG